MHCQLSIVIPVYNEQQSIEILYAEIVKTLQGKISAYEIIFVDDASTDDSLNIIKKLVATHDNITVYCLKQNSKKSNALLIGITNATGDIIITLDSDLQDDPKHIPEFISQIHKGADIVIGWKQDRLDSYAKKIPSKLANTIANIISRAKFKDMNSGYKAYKKSSLEQLYIRGSLFRFIPHLQHALGYRVDEIPVAHRKRVYGQSKFSFYGRCISFIDICTLFFIVRFKKQPMHFFGGIGFVLLACGSLIGMYLSYLRFMGESIGTRPLLQLSILMILVGIQILSIGLLAELFMYTGNRKEKLPPFTQE